MMRIGTISENVIYSTHKKVLFILPKTNINTWEVAGDVAWLKSMFKLKKITSKG